MPAHVEVYYATYCSYCRCAMRLLDAKGVDYVRHDVTDDRGRRQWLRSVTRRSTVPQIFINGRSVGGSDDLHELDANGQLDVFLAEDPPT
jgi:glutaredoxin 3